MTSGAEVEAEVHEHAAGGDVPHAVEEPEQRTAEERRAERARPEDRGAGARGGPGRAGVRGPCPESAARRAGVRGGPGRAGERLAGAGGVGARERGGPGAPRRRSRSPVPTTEGSVALALPPEPAPSPRASRAPWPPPPRPRPPTQRPETAAGERRAPRENREAAREAREARREQKDREREKEREKDKARKQREEQQRKRDEEKSKPRKTAKIEELLKVGQEVVVQISKDPIGTKGARLTSHISIPGRHLVFMPTVDHVGISRRISNEKERRRLREIVDRLRPPGTGFIVRTVAENVPQEKLETDIRFLIEVWNQVVRRNEKRGGPGLLHPDLDLILRATRDLFAHDVEKLVVDDREEYERILGFVTAQDPALKDRVVLHETDEPIFDAYGIEHELQPRHPAQGVAQERRLPHHRPGRGAHRHRRQLGPLRRQEEPRGDDHQDQRRGGQGDRLPAAAAQHRRHHHLRLHRHGEAAEPGQGLQVAAGGAGPGQGQDQRAAHLRAGPGGDDAQARARVHRPRAARGLPVLRRQGLREDGDHGLPTRSSGRSAARRRATRTPRWSSTATPRWRGCSRARSGRSCGT